MAKKHSISVTNAPEYLKGTDLFRAHGAAEKKELIRIWKSIREYTNSEWSDEAYYIFTSLADVARIIDGKIANDPDSVSVQEIAELRKTKDSMREMITDWEKGGVAKGSAISKLKSLMAEVECSDGTLRVEFKADKEPVNVYDDDGEIIESRAQLIEPAEDTWSEEIGSSKNPYKKGGDEDVDAIYDL